MLGRKPKPVIGILTGSLLSDIMGLKTSPITPAEPKPQSPKKTFDIGAVGLGIVAALEKTGELPANMTLCSRQLSRSIPTPVKNSSRNSGNSEEMETESFEEYTIVICHGPNASYTKVYGDGRKGDDRTPFRILDETVQSNRPSVFYISPPRSVETTAVPPSDFLGSCNLCNKKLHDKDIYMYRGERAFCSTECRYRQMLMDERKERYCSSEASIRAVEVAISPCSQILTTGILAI